MRLLLCSLILAFLSINCFAQPECGQLSKKEIADLKITLQKARAQEDNPYFLALYKVVHPDSAIRFYSYVNIYADRISFDKKIEDMVEQVEYELWFYTRDKKRYKVTANGDFSDGFLYPALGYQSKILNKIAKMVNLREICIVRIGYIDNWFVYKDGQLFVLKGSHLRDANAYFKRKYALDQFKRILHPINGT
jgi:hypothetical protein